MIKKSGKKYKVMSESGKCMGTYTSRKDAEKRLKEIEMFKHMKKNHEKMEREHEDMD